MKQNQTKVFELINETIFAKIRNGENLLVKTQMPIDVKGTTCYIDEPRNYETNKAYTGVNRAILPSGYYLTPNQVFKLKGKIKKGAKTTLCTLCIPREFITFTYMSEDNKTVLEKTMYKSTFEKLDPQPEVIDKKEFTTFTWTYFRVLNINDCENLPEFEWLNKLPKVKKSVKQPTQELSMLAEYVLKQNVDGDNQPKLIKDCELPSSCYNPKEDAICMKNFYEYKDASDYYNQLFHELSHSTGYKTRLDREGIKNSEFGDDNYSVEELIAQTTATYIMGKLDLLTNKLLQESKQYIQSWYSHLSEKLKSEPNLLVRVLTQSDKAYRYIFKVQ